MHATIASRTVAGGSAILVRAGALTLTNTIIASHTIGISATGGTVIENYTLFFRNGLDRGAGIATGPNSRTGDPRFVSAVTGDFHINSTSLAKNVGVDAGVTTDFEGDARPQDAFFDIGFDEYVAPACFASPNNGVKVFSSVDAQALRDALGAVAPGGTVKVAGTCAGAVLEWPEIQVALITQSVSLIGGFRTAAVSITQPPMLNALGGGRVLRVDAPRANLTVQSDQRRRWRDPLWRALAAVQCFRAPAGSRGGASIAGPAKVEGGLFQNSSANRARVVCAGTVDLSGTLHRQHGR
jgi:hypothetical protein